MLRRDAVRSQRVPKYDNKCRNLTKVEINEKITAGVQYCIRFKVCYTLFFIAQVQKTSYRICCLNGEVKRKRWERKEIHRR